MPVKIKNIFTQKDNDCFLLSELKVGDIYHARQHKKARVPVRIFTTEPFKNGNGHLKLKVELIEAGVIGEIFLNTSGLSIVIVACDSGGQASLRPVTNNWAKNEIKQAQAEIERLNRKIKALESMV